MKTIIHAALAALAITGGSGAQAAPFPWSDLIVFGDSLSDGGNFGPGVTLTNGAPWSTQVGATPAALGGTNYAFADAEALDDPLFPFDLQTQLGLFASAPPALGPDPLTVFWLGGNDILSEFQAPPFGVVDPAPVAQAIADGIGFLATNFGLDRFLVVGLPDLGAIPRLIGTGLETLATTSALALNASLRSIAQSDAGLPIDVGYVDVFALFEEIEADKAAFGFDNITEACQDSFDRTAPCDGFLFWDSIHPTEAAHALVAAEIVAAAAIPLPPGHLLLLGGLGALVLVGRRDRAAG